MSFQAKAMTVSLLMGLLTGCIASAFNIDIVPWLQPLGDLFFRLIRMIVVPLILCILVGAVAKVSLQSAGSIAVKTLTFFSISTVCAVCLGIIVTLLIRPGLGLELTASGIFDFDASNAPSWLDTLLGIVPLNPVQAAVEGNMLQIIFFASLFGLFLGSMGERGKSLLEIFDLAGETMIRMTSLVMYYAPIGVFGFISCTVAQHGLEIILPLVKLVITLLIACLAQIVLVYFPALLYSGIRIRDYFRHEWPPMLIALATCSSAAVLPANLQAVKKLGVSNNVASFSIPLGAVINMDGVALYIGALTVFAADLYHIPLGMQDYFLIVLLGILGSVANATIPGGHWITVSMAFVQFNIPIEVLGLVAAVDRILDMQITTLNIMGDATCAVLVSNLEDTNKELPDAKVQE